MYCNFVAAKLGRRSRKMREMISDATRTIEDSQTAQALHGLLSLKSPESSNSNFPALLRAVGQQVGGGQQVQVNKKNSIVSVLKFLLTELIYYSHFVMTILYLNF